MLRGAPAVIRVHLDTDLGGDPDDACALAYLLGRADVDVVGITTSIDRGGVRAGHVSRLLAVTGHTSIPVVAGAALSMTTLEPADPVMDPAIAPQPAPPGAALELLAAGIDSGATVIAVGPLTNLALLEVFQPGSLGRAPVVVMGGWVTPPASGLPQWPPARDFNIQWDTRAAEIVATTAADLTLVTLPATLTAHLRASDFPRLRASGPLGAMLADQTETHAQATGKADLPVGNPRLPADLRNFHYDPVTAAIAVGWDGARIEEMAIAVGYEGDVLRFWPRRDGHPIKVVTSIDGARFASEWLDVVTAIPSAAVPGA